jgi:hypothetical protein
LTYDPYTPEKVAVTVSGRSYAVTADDHGMPDMHASHIDVRVERRVADIVDPVLGWEPADLPAAVPDTDPQPDVVLWHGHIILPSTRASGDYRIVVREYETLGRRPTKPR